jgi:hypothetical protein
VAPFKGVSAPFANARTACALANYFYASDGNDRLYGMAGSDTLLRSAADRERPWSLGASAAEWPTRAATRQTTYSFFPD